MYNVAIKFRVGNQLIDNAKRLEGINGWKVGKPYKYAIMCVLVNFEFERAFETKEDYEKNFGAMESQCEKDLESAGFSRSFIENNKKIVLPEENKKEENTEEPPMTWKKWHEERQK